MASSSSKRSFPSSVSGGLQGTTGYGGTSSTSSAKLPKIEMPGIPRPDSLIVHAPNESEQRKIFVPMGNGTSSGAANPFFKQQQHQKGPMEFAAMTDEGFWTTPPTRGVAYQVVQQRPEEANRQGFPQRQEPVFQTQYTPPKGVQVQQRQQYNPQQYRPPTGPEPNPEATESWFQVGSSRFAVVKVWKGRVYVGIRQYMLEDDQWRVTRNGINLTDKEWKSLAAHVGEIDAAVAGCYQH